MLNWSRREAGRGYFDLALAAKPQKIAEYTASYGLKGGLGRDAQAADVGFAGGPQRRSYLRREFNRI